MEFILSIKFVLLLIAVITDIVLALLVYSNNPKSATNRIYALLSFTIGIWLTVNYISLLPSFLKMSIFWIRLSIFFAVPMSVLFFLLADTLPEQHIRINIKGRIAIFAITIFTMAIALSPYAFVGTEVVNNEPRPIPGPGIIIFTLVSSLFSLLALIVLVKKLRTSKGIQNTQYWYMFTGILAMLGLIITTVLIPVILFKVNTFVSLIPLYTLVFLGLTTYAIIKHRFLDVGFLVGRSVAFSLFVLVVTLLYSISLFGFSTFITGETISPLNLLVSVVFVLIAAFSFPMLRRYIEKLTEKIFYKHDYKSNELLNRMSHIMASTFTLSELVENVLKFLFGEISITHGSIVLTRESAIVWMKTVGKDEKESLHEKEIEYLEKTSMKVVENILIFEELPESEEKRIMRDYNITVVLPLRVKDETIGVLLLGPKASGEIYSVKDIDVLKILAPEFAVAVKNSLSYEEIKRFNVTLEEEVKRATTDLEHANERLKELDQLKDEFVSVASHELRTPMTAIKSYLWLALQGKGGDLNEKQKHFLDRAYSSTDRLIKLVNDMLNVSRIESGRLSLQVDKVNINKLIEDVIGEVKPRADELGIKIVINTPPSIALIPVMADSDKVKEVIINLVGNSLKFTPKDGTITLTTEEKDDKVLVHVIDTGEGIGADDIGKLFEKFGFVKGSYTTNQAASQGTGLGLYICREIIQMHKGYIWAESSGHGKGATFSFSLKKYDETLARQINDQSKGKEGMGLIHTGI